MGFLLNIIGGIAVASLMSLWVSMLLTAIILAVPIALFSSLTFWTAVLMMFLFQGVFVYTVLVTDSVVIASLVSSLVFFFF